MRAPGWRQRSPRLPAPRAGHSRASGWPPPASEEGPSELLARAPSGSALSQTLRLARRGLRARRAGAPISGCDWPRRAGPAPRHWPQAGPASRGLGAQAALARGEPSAPPGPACRAERPRKAAESRESGVGRGARRGAGAEHASYGERRARPGLSRSAAAPRWGWAPAAALGGRGVGVARAGLGSPGCAVLGSAGAGRGELGSGSWTWWGLEGSGWLIRFGLTWYGSGLGRQEVLDLGGLRHLGHLG